MFAFLLTGESEFKIVERSHVGVSNPQVLISNGNRTEWSPIRSVIIRVITKSDDRAAGV